MFEGGKTLSQLLEELIDEFEAREGKFGHSEIGELEHVGEYAENTHRRAESNKRSNDAPLHTKSGVTRVVDLADSESDAFKSIFGERAVRSLLPELSRSHRKRTRQALLTMAVKEFENRLLGRLLQIGKFAPDSDANLVSFPSEHLGWRRNSRIIQQNAFFAIRVWSRI